MKNYNNDIEELQRKLAKRYDRLSAYRLVWQWSKEGNINFKEYMTLLEYINNMEIE